MLTFFDFIITPIYVLLILAAALAIRREKIGTAPHYQYYFLGLVAKITGAIGLSLVYVYYYKGGDTINYYEYGSSVMLKLFLKSPTSFFDIVFNGFNDSHWGEFDYETGWLYYTRDTNSFFVIRFISPLTLIAFNSYLTTAVLLATICYTGVWRLYEVFVSEFPYAYKKLAIAILFIPSVVFWGSGILKDSISLAAVGWYVYGFYHFFIKKEFKISYGLQVLIAAYLLVAIKPYILYALLPGSLLWLNNQYLSGLKSRIARFIATPLLLVVIAGLGYVLVLQLGSDLGKYSIGTILERAVITQRDLRMDYYGGNTFDIGDFDASIGGVLSKAPLAIISGLFRPFIWEVRNPFMLLSAIENIFMVYMTLYVIFKGENTIGKITAKPLIMFALVFAIFFSFSVGLTTPNFGSLVRYRIPAIPFWLSGVYLLLMKRSVNKL